ncbi:MAG: penicillin-binding protein 1C [Sporocytophaga sp.]|nr:penicillin-binding protein 1C [Sporocytophaga sp.]
MIVFLLSITIIYWHCLPSPLFTNPFATILTDRNNLLLSARIADDGQWRFPSDNNIPDKFKKALVCFEDKRFYYHPGIDILALFRAIKINIKKSSIISGGSTISMQVIRLSRKGKSRTLYEKFIEMIWATRLEIQYSKEEILNLYASNAPFGGNIVGLEAASWKYFGRSPHHLSWAETATLAVLPNAPGLIHPGRNRKTLKRKRDKLLEKLKDSSIIDSLTFELSRQEPLPENPLKLEDKAPHLVERIKKKFKTFPNDAAVYHSTIDKNIQEYTQKIIHKHHHRLAENSIHNLAALIIENESGNILSYVGNTSPEKMENGNHVDIITSKRSTGSILKPLLYAMMLNEGYLLPHTLISDIPVNFGGFTPKNFDKTYEGAVPVNVAISKSLNIPSVYMLNQYGPEKFLKNLKELGINSLNAHARHYGLSIILGGAEVSMEDIGIVYSSLARQLNNAANVNSKKEKSITFCYDGIPKKSSSVDTKGYKITPSSIWYMFEAMAEVVRPNMESNWQTYDNSKMAWKTGTSFGFRDAWAVGCSPRYTIVVWAGNANGEGRPDLTGIAAAAPVLFDLFSGLKSNTQWFRKPVEDMTEIMVCKQSGHRATDLCTDTHNMFAPKSGIKVNACPYHQMVNLDASEKYQVQVSCYAPSDMIRRSWFVLPPAQELYYKNRNADYSVLPDFKEDCNEQNSNDQKTLDIIYPRKNSKIYVPVNLDGTRSKVILQVSSGLNNKTVYWHLDDQFIGETTGIHEMAMNPSEGKHVLTVIDGNGTSVNQHFEIIERIKK